MTNGYCIWKARLEAWSDLNPSTRIWISLRSRTATRPLGGLLADAHSWASQLKGAYQASP